MKPLAAILVFAFLNSPATAQVPISGAIPPWTLPTPLGRPTPAPPSPPESFVPGSPSVIQVPAGKPLVGFAKYNLSGFAGNARAFGSFTITLPIPSEVDPDNASVPYRTFGRSCRNR